ncbi:MAG: DNA-binding response regulator [Actinobacteria bacterium 69-20]|nr:MAG: DNA-binding response regulator [Actinobacteria bacterium 69-20]
MRVLLADDHPLFRDGLRGLIADTDGFEVVGEAASGAEAIELAATTRPDIVLMDLRMPGIDGVEATRRILHDGSAAAVLALTMSDDDGLVFAALRAGARGYILKGATGHDIVESLRIVASGRAILDAPIAARMDRYFARHQSAPHPAFPHLSAREQDILTLMSAGLSNAEIAARLVLSEKTVRNNVSTVFTKLGVATRAAAVAHARDAGLGAPPPMT